MTEWMMHVNHPEYGRIDFRWTDDAEHNWSVYTLRGKAIKGSLTVGFAAAQFGEDPTLDAGSLFVYTGAPTESQGRSLRFGDFGTDRLTINNARLPRGRGLDFTKYMAQGWFDPTHYYGDGTSSEKVLAKMHTLMYLVLSHWLSREAETMPLRLGALKEARCERLRRLRGKLADIQRRLAQVQREEAEQIEAIDRIETAMTAPDTIEPEPEPSTEPEHEPEAEPDPADNPEPAKAEGGESEPMRNMGQLNAPVKKPLSARRLALWPVLTEPVPVRRVRLGHLTRKRHECEKGAADARRKALRLSKGHQDIAALRRLAERLEGEAKEHGEESDAIIDSGVRLYRPDDLKPGGLVLQGSTWFEVKKVNVKSVTIPDFMHSQGEVRAGHIVHRCAVAGKTLRRTWDRIDDYLPPDSAEAVAMLSTDK